MLSSADTAVFSTPPAHVTPAEQGRGVEHFSRHAPDPSWRRWIDWLQELDRDPRMIEDDLVEPPSPEAIAQALSLLESLRETDPVAPPSAVVVGPNGDITIERRVGGSAMAYTVYDDLRIDLDIYEGGRLNRTIPLP